jgi:nucleoid-associated protein YgaU
VAKADAEEKIAAALRSQRSLTQERDELAGRVTELTAKFAEAQAALAAPPPPTATELDRLRARASAAERDTELARAELTRVNQVLATTRLAQAQPARPAAAPRELSRPSAPSASPGVAPATASAAAGSPPRTHVIAAGETLAGISRLYYGTPNRWSDLLAANRDWLRDEKSLTAGRILRIP